MVYVASVALVCIGGIGGIGGFKAGLAVDDFCDGIAENAAVYIGYNPLDSPGRWMPEGDGFGWKHQSLGPNHSCDHHTDRLRELKKKKKKRNGSSSVYSLMSIGKIIRGSTL
jgi:hypothetical protein